MPTRNDEQLEAVKELTEREIQDARKFQSLPQNTIGVDGICIASCIVNGWDTLKELAITEENGFSRQEILYAHERFTVRTAKFFELI
jgi:hypothetical protein